MTTEHNAARTIAVDQAMLEDFDARLEREPQAIQEWFGSSRLGLGVRLALRAAAEQLRGPRVSTLTSVSADSAERHEVRAALAEDLRSEGGEAIVTLNGIVVWRQSYARGDLGGRGLAIEGAQLYTRTIDRALRGGA